VDRVNVKCLDITIFDRRALFNIRAASTTLSLYRGTPSASFVNRGFITDTYSSGIYLDQDLACSFPAPSTSLKNIEIIMADTTAKKRRNRIASCSTCSFNTLNKAEKNVHLFCHFLYARDEVKGGSGGYPADEARCIMSANSGPANLRAL
jgi:hypothetical protein